MKQDELCLWNRMSSVSAREARLLNHVERYDRFPQPQKISRWVTGLGNSNSICFRSGVLDAKKTDGLAPNPMKNATFHAHILYLHVLEW